MLPFCAPPKPSELCHLIDGRDDTGESLDLFRFETLHRFDLPHTSDMMKMMVMTKTMILMMLLLTMTTVVGEVTVDDDSDDKA